MRTKRPWALIGALALAACSEGVTGPGSNLGTGFFSEQIPFTTFEEEVAGAPTRVEIELIPGTLIAREVEIKESDELFDREEIESRVVEVVSDGTTGSVRLALGDLVVDFDRTTRFETEGSGDVGFDEFVSRLEDALAAGRHPPIEAKREPAAEPQAPDDPTFFATRLELDDEADEPEIEINVDLDNLISNAAPPPDGWLQVLGLLIELRHTEGITEIERERDDLPDDVDFEGVVASVDEAAGTVTLTDGTVIRIGDGTEIESDDDEDEIGTLAGVAEAVAAGLIVEADGEGIIEGTSPLTILAREIEFEIEDDEDDVPGEVEVEGIVASVGESGVTLTNGTVVLIDEHTDFDGADDDGNEGDDDDLRSLEEVQAALDAGRLVEVEAEGELLSTVPLTILANEVEFEIAN